MKNTLTKKGLLFGTLFLCLVVGIGLLTSTALFATTSRSGDVIRDGSIIRAYQDDTSYIVKIVGNKLFKRPILTSNIFKAYPHLTNTDTLIVYKDTFDTFKTSTLIMEVNSDGTPTTGRVYYLSVHPEHRTVLKHHLNITAQQFEQIGFDWDSIYHINHTEASERFYSKGPEVTASDLGITSQPSHTTEDKPFIVVPAAGTPAVDTTTSHDTTVPYIDVSIGVGVDVSSPFINRDIQSTSVNREVHRPTQIATPPRLGTKTNEDGSITRTPHRTVAPENAVYYTSNHPQAAYYYSEDCTIRNTIPSRYEERFSSLSQLFEKYSRTLHPDCI